MSPTGPPDSPRHSPPGKPPSQLDETPPLLGSWRNIYALVLGSQALVAILFYLITRMFE